MGGHLKLKVVQRFSFRAEFWLPWQPKGKHLNIYSCKNSTDVKLASQKSVDLDLHRFQTGYIQEQHGKV